MTKAEFVRLTKLLATPLDLAGLVRDGVLKKRGAWYEVLDYKRLPEHAGQLVSEIKQVTKGDTQTTLMKFRRPSARAARLLKKLSPHE